MDDTLRLEIIKELRQLAKEHKDTSVWIERLNRKRSILKQRQLELLADLAMLNQRNSLPPVDMVFGKVIG